MSERLVALAPATRPGIALYAGSSPRPRGEGQALLQMPAAHHPPGASVRCSHVEILQVPRTHRVLGFSPGRAFGFEHGVNEHRLAIGHAALRAREPLEPAPGLVGTELARLGLERAASAREALDVITQLLERYGQGVAVRGPHAPAAHAAFLLADPREAWALETSNRRWAARRVELARLSSRLSIRSDWERASPDLERFAFEQGWWKGPGRLDFAAAYRDPSDAEPAGRSRGPSASPFEPARGRIDVGVLEAWLREHGEGGPDAPCLHAATALTAASLIAPLPRLPDPAWAVWICFASPCAGLFLPVHPEGVIPDVLARGGADTSDGSLWWRLEGVADAVLRDAARLVPRAREQWAELEREIEAERRGVESRARAAGDGAAAILSEFMRHMALRVDERAAAILTQLG